MSLKKQAISGVVWTFVQQFSVQIINFVVQIILARLLMPEIFGLIAMLTVFISIGQTLMDSGMTSSLIRTKEPDQLDYSTVFMTNMIISVAVYLLTFAGAPWVAKFYDQPILKDILRVYSITFVIRAFVAVHVAKLTKEMNFKTQMKLQVPSTIAGAIVGIVMAYMGYGVWSLVFLNLTQTIVFTIQNWVFITWRPSFVFNKEKFKEHFSFGYKLTLSGILDTLYRNIYNIVVGKAYNPILVGYFNHADTMRKFPVSQISSVMGKVTYPLFSSIEDNVKLKSAYKQTMKLVFFVVVPMMTLLIVSGNEIFYILFGEKWLPAVPFFQILAIDSITVPLSTYNLNILKVKGRSDLLLRLEVVKKSIGFIAVFVAVPFGIDVLVISYVLVGITNTVINMIFSGRYINYSFTEQMRDISIILFSGFIMLTVGYILNKEIFIDINSNLLLIGITSLLILIVYLSLIFLFDKNIFRIIKNVLRS